VKIIKISTSDSIISEIFLRQTEGREGIWGDCKFIVNKPVIRCDWWFICHQSAIQEHERTICDPKHIIFVSMEPTEGTTPQIFYEQFSKLLLCDINIKHPNIQYINWITWWVGIQVKFENGHKYLPTISYDYDSFKKMDLPVKNNRISVIYSDKNWFPGHTKRLEFLEKLKLHPISQYIDFYGGGHNPILDKLDAIAPYKYHLVIENSVVKDYWSEKLGDPFLGFALPIYYGCPNIEKYFSNNSLIRIDIDNFEITVATLERIINEDIYESYLPAIIEARNLILDRYNIFQLMVNICVEPAKRFVSCSVRPSWYFVGSWPRRLVRDLIHRFRRNLSV
jgi:hypothetical protein